MNPFVFTADMMPLLEAMPQPLAIYRLAGRQVYAEVFSNGFCKLFGYKDRQKAYIDMNTDMFRYTHPDDVARVSDAIQEQIRIGGGVSVYYRTQIRDGSSQGYRIIHATGNAIPTDSDIRTALVTFTDEGPYQEESEEGEEQAFRRTLVNMFHEESILRASRYDAMTGLPGMTWFFQLAESMKKKLMETGTHSVLMFIDMNGMKYYNAKYGFSEGDELLKAFARLLEKIFGRNHCCRIAGDHFLACWRDEGLEPMLESLLQEAQELNDGRSLPVHMGIYSTSLENVPVSIACDRAKYACDTLRNTYQSACCRYEIGMKETSDRRQYILTHLDQALSEKWIQVYYQPIVRAVNGRVCEEEALARWIDPEHGFLSPAEFIPVLEDAGVLYKLDLYMVDRVLDKIRQMEEAGHYIVPQSVNLSRSDFDILDMAEEVRSRVDEAGISRDKITIEITESVFGDDFEFMKEQVIRFRQLGFAVWLDDFGTGYSSLDVLQSIPFDLIKFDMSFMKKLEEGDNGKIVLTDLVRMATELEIDTVCEGVETEAQACFLQEIGCAKLQGYYYQRPIPLEDILQKYREGRQIGFENPRETAYFDSIGRVNLYDLTVITGEENESFRNFFNILPMCIMEIKGADAHYARTNQPYRDFMMRFFQFDVSDPGTAFSSNPDGPGAAFMTRVRECCETGNRVFSDELMPDGTMIHSFARRVGENPITGTVAVAVAVLSVTGPGDGTTYSVLARSLAADYYSIYYVNLDTDEFIEYSSSAGTEELAMERHRKHFFETARKAVHTRIYEEDRDAFLDRFTRENILRELDEQGVFNAAYRLIDTGRPIRAKMKITRTRPDESHLVIGVSIEKGAE